MSELYIAHHGILGQKWGKRNGPPYPLDAEDHSAAEKKEGWRKSLKSARSVQKELNRQDKKQAKIVDNLNETTKQHRKTYMEFLEAEDEAKAIANRLRDADDFTKARVGGPYVRKWEDKGDEVFRLAKRINLGEEELKRAEMETWKLIAAAEEAGYTISSKKILRDAKAGKRMAATILGGPLGHAAYSAVTGGSGYVEGNKYTVKKSKDGQGSISMEQHA